MPATDAPAEVQGRIADAVRQYWGYDTLRPLQDEAILAGLAQRDSLVVLPTGGGKSLCYQVPPIVAERIDVVVSPLISLMKDQVDGLRACGYPAAALHSQLTAAERREAFEAMDSGTLRLLFVSPERLAGPGFQSRLERLDIHAFAIDEAHCISQWGHDFRPEYRQLAFLKERFPGASVHAFTATATPRVREDIVHQLNLAEPRVLIGRFDRPNLTYRVKPRVDQLSQIVECIDGHRDEAVIVYCLSRNDTETIARNLRVRGVDARAYHAGLSAQERRKTQDAFAAERLDVVVATVAFGMGIDRSNVRCVIHAAMPKSVEHYQQETGRAGRDGLEAECLLLYSAADVIRWQGLMERSCAEAGGDDAALTAQLELLRQMQGVCATLECRHHALTRYFGQAYPDEPCGACDVRLDEVKGMDDATVVAQKIISCVARLEQRYGVGHVVAVLRGADTENVRRWGHDQLSTHGLLRETPEKALTNLVYQLVDQNLLARTPGDRPVVTLTPESMPVLRGERDVRLIEPKMKRARTPKEDASSWEGVDRDLFEHLRSLRREVAAERAVPAYIVFGDVSLRDMARIRPGSESAMRRVHGVGDKKLADFGAQFAEAVADYCREKGLSVAE